MQTLVIETEGEKLKALEAFLSALDIPFRKEEETPYSPEFVRKIRESEEDKKAGRTVEFKKGENLWGLAITE